MPKDLVLQSSLDPENISQLTAESFDEVFAEFERTHSRKTEGDARQIEAIVVSLDKEYVYFDIGFKTEGVLPRDAFDDSADKLAKGDKVHVSVKARNPEGYYELSRVQVKQLKDWSSLEEAFAQKAAVVGVVTGVVKGGFTVDVGVRAFMPASRSGVRDAAEIEKLVGQEITCCIIKLDTTEEDVVVDRRAILEQQARLLEQSRYAELKTGDIVSGQVRSLAAYGAFVDLGGVDGLLHISDISWSRVNAPEDVLSVGQQLKLKVLKVETESKRISLGLKQLEAEPWDSGTSKYAVGQRITGAVTRLMDFGAFVELEPGIEGLVHVSEMSWIKKVRKPADILKSGDAVEVVILSINPTERRISLGLKQALGDPWKEVLHKFPVGSAIKGPVVRLMKFGAFVQLSEGVEGLIHVSEIVNDRHIHHPQDVLKVGQAVDAQVLSVDEEKRQIRLSMKQLIPTGLDEYLEEHKEGDVVTGRVVEQSSEVAVIELGDGIRATCATTGNGHVAKESSNPTVVDLSQLTNMLTARWKSGRIPSDSQQEILAVGQVRRFRLVKLDRQTKQIEVGFA